MMRTSVVISIAMGVFLRLFFASWTAVDMKRSGDSEQVRGLLDYCWKKRACDASASVARGADAGSLRCSAVVGVLDQPADIGAVEGARVPVRVGHRLVGGPVDPVLRHADFLQRYRCANRGGIGVQPMPCPFRPQCLG